MKFRYLLAAIITVAIGFGFVAFGQTNPGTSPLTIAKGGTGASTASAARTSLGLALGTNAQAWDADLDALAALASTGFPARTASNTWSQRTIAVPTGLSIANAGGVGGDPTISWNIAALSANGSPSGGSTFIPCETSGTMNKCDVADLGVGGGGGMSSNERQNFLLSLIYQSKLFGDYRRLIHQFATGFKASSDTLRGINAGSSSNYDATNAAASGYIAPTTSCTGTSSYANSGGTGDRTGSITVSVSGSPFDGSSTPNRLVNGSTSGDNYTNGVGMNGTTVTGQTITFDFGSGQSKYITEAKWYMQTATGHGTWKWGGSTDNSSYTDIGSSFTLGGATTQTQTELSGNTNGYRYYRLTGVSGTSSASPFNYEIEFKIVDCAAAPNNMTLVTISQTDSTVSNGRVLIEYNPIDAITLDTDLTAEVSCNNGSNWASAALSSAGTGQAGRSVAETSDTACTSGASFAARIKSLNNKSVQIHGVTMTVH